MITDAGTRDLRGHRFEWMTVTALSVAVFVLYWPAVMTGLVSDDWSILYRSSARTPDEFWRMLQPTPDWFYRPVQKIVFWLSLQIFGLAGWPLHLFFLSLHVLNGVLLWRIGRSQAGPAAGLGAMALFVLHYRAHETVSWAAAGADMLAATFSLLSVLFFVRWQQQRVGWLAVMSALAYALAVLGKESAAGLPAFLFILLLVRGGAGRKPTVYVPLLLFLLVAAGFVWLQVTTGSRDEEESLTRGGLSFGPQASSIWIASDLVTAALPPIASTSVPLSPLGEPRDWALWLAIVSIGAMIFRRPAPMLGLVWAVAMTLVYIPFIEAIEDRYVYLPSAGVDLALAGALTAAAGLLARVVPAAGTGTIGAGLTALPTVLCVVLAATSAPLLTTRIAAWHEAGVRAELVLAEVQRQAPAPRPGALIAVVGAPDRYEGAFIFRNGLPEALRLVYGDRALRVAVVPPGQAPPAADSVVTVPQK